ncbi:hypothetical protein BCF74_10212 [Knoellia remsis]|uniref:Uncharacterized protein n=1 Tax=Knoellia remsis TaxID=407159 RepID=A0A2T0UZ39_9MICO|nr:hypothetical protein [Knoellia remsis]PRY63181.1 hypothetical protein BCF74_10212 [Knoellia remsis]
MSDRSLTTSYDDTRVRIGAVFMLAIGGLMAIAYVVLALSTDLLGLLAGVPVAVLGMVCVWIAMRRWTACPGQRGGLWMLLGSVLIIGSLWAAFLTGDAISG